MPITNRLRKLLHRKAWEFCSPTPVATAAATFVAGAKGNFAPADDTTYYVASASSIWAYNAAQDAWVGLPSSGLSGTMAAGSCGEFHPIGMLGGSSTSTAGAGGTTTTIVTNRTITRSLAGCRVRVLSGTNAGYEGTVVRNTINTNAVLTVTPAAGAAFDPTSVFEVYSGSLWFFFATSTTVNFSVYDRATNTWTAKSVTGLPATFGTEAQLVGTPSIVATFASGTATAGAATTLTDGSKSWPTNAWANYQVRITAGTGAGQIRTIASNTATALTVSASWGTNPDATSQYAIEGNNDNLYLFGNNAVTAYRYSISANTWATLAPVAARSAAMAAGGTADWIDSVPAWSEATAGQAHTQSGAIMRQAGRYIYCFRGGGSSAVDVYDIARNTWVSSLPYGNQNETFTTGSSSIDVDGFIYIQKEATGRIYRLNIDQNVLEPWANNVYVQSTTVVGDKMFSRPFVDGGTTLRWVYTMLHTRAELLRMLIID